MAKTPNMHLVLVGAGHSHLVVLKDFIDKPIKNLNITVISHSHYIPYSGMIPGLIAGHYNWEQCHVDLAKLCHRAGAKLIVGDINQIDTSNSHVSGVDIEPIQYNWLSLNTGSQNYLDNIKGANYEGLPAKPIENFIQQWKLISTQIHQHSSSYKIAIVGGGAASVELALAMQHQILSNFPGNHQQPKFSLISSAKKILPQHSDATSKLAQKILRRQKIKITLNSRVTEAHHYGLELENGNSIAANCVIWATQAGCPKWLKNTGISCDEKGFINVNRFMQSCSHPNIFAAGDMINFSDQPLPKSGVYAIRTGQALAKNLHNTITNKKLTAYKPQRFFLNLLALGDKEAIASWGGISAKGRWVWHWKNRLDQRFIKKINR